jgi:hypothetical protein
VAKSVRVKNLDALLGAFVAAGADAPRFAAKALYEEANEAFIISSYLVPLRTGNLLSSGEVRGPFIRGGTRAEAEISYGGPSAPYALFVHEIPPPPAQSQGGRSARHDYPTRWKYLEFAVRAYAKDMGPRMATRVLDMVNRRFEIG